MLAGPGQESESGWWWQLWQRSSGQPTSPHQVQLWLATTRHPTLGSLMGQGSGRWSLALRSHEGEEDGLVAQGGGGPDNYLGAGAHPGTAPLASPWLRQLRNVNFLPPQISPRSSPAGGGARARRPRTSAVSRDLDPRQAQDRVVACTRSARLNRPPPINHPRKPELLARGQRGWAGGGQAAGQDLARFFPPPRTLALAQLVPHTERRPGDDHWELPTPACHSSLPDKPTEGRKITLDLRQIACNQRG